MSVRKILMLDTETANGLDAPLVYQIGVQIVDTQGNVYDAMNMLIREIFVEEQEKMQSAYYADKIPSYWNQYWKGELELVSLYEARRRIIELCNNWGCTIWCAHNAYFDNRALNNTERYVTENKYQYFFPFGMEIWDTMRMARDVILPTAKYQKFCHENDYLCKNGRPRLTAEILFRFISDDNDFVEEHKALEDVTIESQILAYCFAKHKAMRTKAYMTEEEKEKWSNHIKEENYRQFISDLVDELREEWGEV